MYIGSFRLAHSRTKFPFLALKKFKFKTEAEVLISVLMKNIRLVYIVIGTKYSRMGQVEVLKGCLPQISLGPLLNTLFQFKLQR